MRTTKKLLALSLAAAILPGCGSDDKDGRSVAETTQFQEANAEVGATALFDPAGGADFLPFPVDLLFSGTVDLTVNIPGKGNSFDPATPATLLDAVNTPTPQELADPQTALNTVTGFSTTAPMVARFSNNIASPSGHDDGVRVFRLSGFDPGGSFGATVDRELVYGAEFVAGANGASLLVIPTKPLDSSTTHIVAIDSNLTSASGEPVAADDTYQLLNGSFQLTTAIAAATGGAGQKDFVEEADGDPCDFVNAPGDCTVVNTADYQDVIDNIPDPTAVAIATAIRDTLAGLAASDFSSLFQLESLRRITDNHLTLLDGEGVDTTTLALTYSVTTQETVGPLAAAQAVIQGATSPSIDVLNPIASWDGAGTGEAWELVSPGADGDPAAGNDYYSNIFLGNLNGALQFVNPDQPNTSVWQADPLSWDSGGLGGACSLLPANATGTENLVPCNSFVADVQAVHSFPVMISAPRAESLAGGGDLGDIVAPDCSAGDLPVVVFQHGITTSRATLLAIADALGQACMVGVAIDLPKHGILPENDPFGASLIGQLQQAYQQPPFAGAANPTPVLERLVKVASPMDECQAGTGTSVLPDDGEFYCPSADNYINLTNLANARDTARQGVADLFSLYAALVDNGTTDLVAATIGTTIDPANIHFVGVSLGGIAGTPFLALEGGVQTATLNVTSGNIAKLLDGSSSFEPSITQGLYDGAGIAKPSGDYEGFLILAQNLTDSADPINFASLLQAQGTPVLVQEVTGNGDSVNCILTGENCPDQTVPNNVFGSSFGPAWGAIDQVVVGMTSPDIVAYQSSFLPGQNFLTTPVALAGTDALAQGTGFITMAGALQADPGTWAGPVAGTGHEDSNDIVSTITNATTGIAVSAFDGLGLPEVGACGAAGSGVVRFIEGSHGSLLSPSASLNTTTLMQTQVVGFISTGNIAADPNQGTADQVVRTNRGCP